MAEKDLKGTRVGPILKQLMSGDAIALDQKSLNKIGRLLVACVKEEAQKDFAKRKQPGIKGPFDLPDSRGRNIRPSFFDSFSYRISGQKTLEVVSSWPWIELLVKGNPGGDKMVNHTQANPKMWKTRIMKDGHIERIPKSIPFIQKSGAVVFRMAPVSTATAWIHPKIAKHTFVNRGLERARKKLMQEGMMAEILFDQLQRTAK